MEPWGNTEDATLELPKRFSALQAASTEATSGRGRRRQDPFRFEGAEFIGLGF